MQLFIFDKEEGKSDHWRNSDHEKKSTFILDLVNLCQIKLYLVIPLLIKEILINNSSKWWSFNTFICVCVNERHSCLQDAALNHLLYSVWTPTTSGLLLDHSMPITLMLINIVFQGDFWYLLSSQIISPSSPIFTFRWWPSFCHWRVFIVREISFTHLLFCCSVTKSCPAVLLFHAL